MRPLRESGDSPASGYAHEATPPKGGNPPCTEVKRGHTKTPHCEGACPHGRGYMCEAVPTAEGAIFDVPAKRGRTCAPHSHPCKDACSMLAPEFAPV